MILTKDKGLRMWGGGGSTSVGGGGGSQSLSGYATQDWVTENYLSIEFFSKLFKAYGPAETSGDPDVEVIPNDVESTISNIKAMFGLWTDEYLSALGLGPSGGGGLSLNEPLASINTAGLANHPSSAGQTIVWNGSAWAYGTAGAGSVTSVGMTVPTGFVINGSPITSYGTLALSFATGYGLPLTADVEKGVTAYGWGNHANAGYALASNVYSKADADGRFLTISFFRSMFKAYQSDGTTEVTPNAGDTSLISGIKAMVGLWTDQYISALGLGSGGGGGGTVTLNEPLQSINQAGLSAPSSGGLALVYNGSAWVYSNAANLTVGGSLNVSNSLSAYSATIGGNISAAGNVISQAGGFVANGYDDTYVLLAGGGKSKIKTVNGYSLFGEGNIDASGGGTGNYLPLTGGTLSNSAFAGQLTIKREKDGGDAVIAYRGLNSIYGYIGVTSSLVPVFYRGTDTSGSGYTIWHSGNDITLVKTNTAQDISGLKTMTNGLIVSGRIYGTGDDEGLLVTGSSIYAGVILGSTTGLRSIFYLKKNSSEAYWRFVDSSNNIYNIYHPQKTGTIAITDDLSYYLPLTGGTLSNSAFAGQLTIKRENDGGDAVIAYRGLNSIYGYIGVTSSLVPVFYRGTDTSNSGYTIWHSGNDGTGSGLDADLLDGKHDGELTAEKLKSPNNSPIEYKNTGGTYLTVFTLDSDNDLTIGTGTAQIGYDTYISGNNVKIRYGTNRTEGIRLTNTGNVGIGSNAPSYKLHVIGYIYTSTGLYSAGYVTALSDIRRKTVIGDVNLTMENVADAPMIKFLWNDRKNDKLQVGSIAQYWQKYLPEAIMTDKEGMLTMDYGIIALLSSIATAKKVKDHERRIAELEKENKELKERLNAA